MKVIKTLFSIESLFFCFLFSGAIRSVLPSVPFNLTIILFVLSGIFGVYKFYKYPKLSKISIYLISLFLLLLLISIISYLYTPSPNYGLNKLVDFILTGWSLLGSFIILRTRESIKNFLNAGILITIVACLIPLANLITIQDLIYSRLGEENSIGLARLAGTGTLLLITIKLFSDGRIKISSLLGFALCFIVLLQTGSRMPLIALLACIILIIFLTKRLNKKYNKQGKGVISLLLFIGVGIILLYLNWNNPKLYTIRIRLEMLLNNGLSDDSASERLKMYSEALAMFADHPFLGNGIGSFSFFYNGTDVRSYPHNIFLEVLSELGIAGFIIFLVLAILGLFSIMKAIKNGLNNMQLSIIILFIYAFINANVTGDINDNRILFAFIAMSCMMPLYNSNSNSNDVGTSNIIETEEKRRVL